MTDRLHSVDEEVEIRPFDLNDAPALFQMTDLNRDRLRVWLPWLDSTKVEKDSTGFIEMATSQATRKSTLIFAILFKGEMAGVISLQNISLANKSANVGYWVDQTFAGHSIAKRCTMKLIQLAFTEAQLNRIEIRCAEGNVASQKVPTSLGFTFEGISRQAEWLYDHFVDHRVYSLLRSEFTFEK